MNDIPSSKTKLENWSLDHTNGSKKQNEASKSKSTPCSLLCRGHPRWQSPPAAGLWSFWVPKGDHPGTSEVSETCKKGSFESFWGFSLWCLKFFDVFGAFGSFLVLGF